MKPDPVRALYARLLRLYPQAFRDRFEADLLQAFDDRRGEPRFHGTAGGLRLVAFLLRDFVHSMPMAHRRRDRRTLWEGMMGDLWKDLQYSIRMLAKSPVFTLAAVGTLALGIGLNTTTFSAVHGLLLAPLPGTEDSSELVQMYRNWGGIPWGSNSIPHYQDVRDRTGDVFEDVAAYAWAPMAVSTQGGAERILGQLVSANFFQTYGVRPALGRAFIPGEEDRGPGAHPVAILGYGYWQSRFAGDPAVIGSTIVLNGHPHEVVGVAPQEFPGPTVFASIPVYVPLMMQMEIMPGFNLIEARGSNSFQVTGRLREGATIEQAQARMDALLVQLREEFPDDYETQLGTLMVPQNTAGIHPSMAEASTGMGAVMMGVVGLLLLIACVNVANLFLSRARDRRREMALRLSLGAGRGRIMRQLLTESLVFSVVAGTAAVAMAHFATRGLNAIRPPMDGPWQFNIALDGTVLLFTAGISVAAGLIFGMAPALQAVKPDTMASVKGDDDGSGRSRASSTLVVLQMALSILLMVTSGLFLRSLQGATRIDPGFDEPSNLVVASVDPGLQGYDDAEGKLVLDRIMERVATIPGVTATGMASSLPLGIGSSDRGVDIPGYDFQEGERRSLPYAWVTEGYLEAMGVDLLEGRTIERSDDGESAPVIVINERIAERFWPGESAVGKTVVTAGAEREVIGVVETGRYQSLGEDPVEFMFIPNRQGENLTMTLAARASRDPQEVLGAIRQAVREVEPDMPIYDVRTMADHMGIALLPSRLGGAVLGLFGVLGMLLAAVGIYGVMAYSVSQRRREIGIRVALGAERADVVRMVLREGMRLAITGMVIGLVGAAALSNMVQGMLYNVSALDPFAFTVVPLLLVSVAGLAVYVPARRASRRDPMRALKAE